jgi:hypothetical protein
MNEVVAKALAALYEVKATQQHRLWEDDIRALNTVILALQKIDAVDSQRGRGVC